jgi:hypothetical protein
MKRTILWIILGVIVLGGLLTLTDLLVPGARGMGYGSMMMSGRMGGGMWEYMLGNSFPVSPIGWVAVWLTWATRLALLALLLTGSVWLIRSLGGVAPNVETPDK